MADPSKRFCLFNCDNTYDLKVVEEFLVEVDEKYGFKITVDHLYFGLRRMAEVCETTIPTVQMDYAIFVVHANESRLSINEDNAGIGYAKLYRALLQKTDNKVLIVIGGDTYYRDDDEKDRFVISRWAKKKVSSQFQDDYLDGRTSFIFSWDKKHRPIHEEAMRHYFDPAKKGFKFEYKPKPKPLPRAPEPDTTPLPGDLGQQPFLVEDDSEILIKDEEENGTRKSFSDRGGDVEQASYGAISPGAGGTSANYPPGTMLLKVRLRNGNISYQNGDVLERKDRWQPSDWQKAVLLQEYRSTAEVIVQFVSSANGGVDYGPVPVKRASGCCNRMCNCLSACFLGLVHYLGVLWGWICGWFRR